MSACEINQAAWKHEQDVGTVHWSGRERCEIATFMSFVFAFPASFLLCVALLPVSPCSKLFDSALRRKKRLCSQRLCCSISFAMCGLGFKRLRSSSKNYFRARPRLSSEMASTADNSLWHVRR